MGGGGGGGGVFHRGYLTDDLARHRKRIRFIDIYHMLSDNCLYNFMLVTSSATYQLKDLNYFRLVHQFCHKTHKTLEQGQKTEKEKQETNEGMAWTTLNDFIRLLCV